VPLASPWRRRVLVGLVWLVATVVLGEVAVRFVAFTLRRDAPGLAAQAGANVDVVYAVGDSFTFGQGVTPEEAWPRVLERRLQEEGGGAREVRVLAAPGASSSLVAQVLAERFQAGDRGLFLILTGWNANDGDFAAHAEARAAPVPWAARLDLWLQTSRLYKVARQALTYRDRTLELEDVRIVPQTIAMSLYDFRAYQEIALENLRTIARLCRAAEVSCVFLTYPHQELPPNPYTRTEYYHALFGRTPLSQADYLVEDRRPGEIAIDAVIRRAGEIEGVPVIDVQPAFDRSEESPLFLDDFHHPTATGHRLMAEAILAALRPPA
jgi:lysophospholipase L1-like esterase